MSNTKGASQQQQQQQQQQQITKSGFNNGDKLRLKRFVPRYVKSGKRSNTVEYDQVANRRGMVVRRGEYFYLDLEFDEVFDDYDLLSFRVSVDDYGFEAYQKSWHLKEEPTRFSDHESYHCPIQMRSVIVYPGSNKVTVVFYTAKNCITAKYWITQMYATRSLEITFNYDMKFPISVVYNPFCPDDAVYLESGAECREYVLESTGRVYFGSSRSIGSKSWNFGQFDDPVLDCAYYLLAKSGLPFDSWGDPVSVARSLSALVNSNDDNGVLVGNWSGDYAGGVAPTEWRGSLAIIAKYYESKTPVKFGQCWVFSGLMTSLARALGIPARSVTNFDSAHDTNCNLIVDSFFNDTFAPIAELNSDSIWNFHVWNDLWMKRPDLGGDFDGWQAVDATPQERSDSIFRTGPCPVKAIKQGKLDVDFDTPFIYAEVNACIKHWQKNADGTNKELYSDPTKVGRSISTKAVGSEDRLDITDQYKFPEGSREEDAAFRAAKNSKKVQIKVERNDDNKRRRNLQLNIATEEYLVIGGDIKVTLELTNGARTDKKILFGIAANLKQYNGKVIRQLAFEKGEVTVKGSSTSPVELAIQSADYTNSAGCEEVGIEIVAVGIDGNDKVVKQTIVHLFNPELDIEIVGEVCQNKAFHFKCTFVNPVPFTLSDARFSIEGPGLRGKSMDKSVGQVKPGDKASCSITLTPVRCGERNFIVSFISKELKGVQKAYPIYVEPDPTAVLEDEIIEVRQQVVY
uniref:protein-glutamine gamma-glutamyltransferase n=2 Tax=Macrostomum lignano TaxID=282301 RepID=A0A1I8I3T9_9PLAT